jgi:flagellin-like protein
VKRIKYEEGVSEVIGTILILAITVILFSAVFVYLQQLPPAQTSEQITVSQEISFNSSSHTLYENITEKTGSILQRSGTYLTILINGKGYTDVISSLEITDPYGNSSGNFEPGDTIHWSSLSRGINVPGNSVVHSILFYKPTNQIVWQTQNNLSDTLSITAAYYYPSPLVANSSFTITVQVFTLDVGGTHVYLNLTSFYGNYFNRSMIPYGVSGNLANYFYSMTAPSLIARSYEVVIYASSSNVSETEDIYLT